VLVTSFSRAAAAELANCDLPIHPDRLGTLHSHCFHALGGPSIAEAHVKEWNRAYPHLAITPVSSQRRLDGEDPVEDDAGFTERHGDPSLQELNRYRGLMIDPSRWPANVRDFEKKWVRYKRDRDLLDFCDLIEICLRDVATAPNNPAVIFADEAQDHNVIQAQLIRKWGRRANYYVLAGDDDQTIYWFIGAAPKAILEPDIPDDHKVILRQSHRVPGAVHRLANSLIRQVTRRQEKIYLPRAATGAIHRLSSGTYKSPEYFIPQASGYKANRFNWLAKSNSISSESDG
jgi:superfamily I DNA/RNA helicase